MSGHDLHLLPNKLSGTSVVARPSKLPIFGRSSTEKHPPRSLINSELTTSPLDRIRPSTIVKPYLAAQNNPTAKNDAQRRRYPASQPNTPVRSSQSETGHELRQLHRFERVTPGSAAPKESGINCALPQSTSFSGSRHASGNQPLYKSKPYHMENMSIEHLQYLEQRLQQLLEITPPRSVPFAKAKSDSGRQAAHPLWMSGPHLNHHQALRCPAVTAPFHCHPHATPLLIFAQQSTPQLSLPSQAALLQTSHPTMSGPEFSDLDPYSRCSPAFSVSSSYAGAGQSSQSFNRDEVHCLLSAVRNMLSMHQQCRTSSTTKSNPTLDPLAVLQNRPFSWYLHHTVPSSPTSSTVNLFVDENYSMNAEIADDREGNKIDDGDEKEERRRNSSVSEESLQPPLLPAGFRSFSRYLDSKFGPDSAEERRSRHHHHQRRRRHELIDNITSPAATTASSIRGNRGRSVTDVIPKISLTTCSGDTGLYSDLPLSPHDSPRQTYSPTTTGIDDGELTQPTCAPYWCPPPLPIASQPIAWYHQVPTPPPPLPPPPPSAQVRYLAAPPPPNAAAACWFRAAANHFATAAAIFAADNATGASSMYTPNQPPVSIPHFTEAAFADRERKCQGYPAPSSFTMYPQNLPSASSSSPGSIPYPAVHVSTEVNEFNLNHSREAEEEDGFFVFSDEEDQHHNRRRRQRRLPAVEPLQRQLWGRLGNDLDAPLGGAQTDIDADCGLDMLPQDPALILPDQVDFYAQIKDLLELDINTSLPLPPGWAVGVSSSGRRFYVSGASNDGGSVSSRITTWRHPVIAPRIPLGWERVEMRRGNFVYYRHLLIPHTQRHHPDLWFPTTLKNIEFEQQSWFFDLRKLQESVSNFDKGNSQLIESYVDTRDTDEKVRFMALFRQYSVGGLETLLKHLDCRFFRDLHRIVVTFEVARIRIVRELFVRHIHRTTATAASCSPALGD